MKLKFETDAALIAAIRSPQMSERDSALKQLYNDPVVKGKIRDLLTMYNLRHLEMKEVLQEGLILLDDLVRAGKFRGESSTRTFLISICKNVMRNDLKKVSKVILRDSFDSTETGVDDASADERIVVLEKNDVEQRRDGVLAQLLEQITGGCRQVLNLYYYEAFSMAQIAAERGLAGAHQAKKAADRCRGQLRDLIGQNPQLAVFLKESMR